MKLTSVVAFTYTSGLPLLGGIGDNLSNTLGVKRCSLCTRNGKGEQGDLGNAEHRGWKKDR